MKHHPFFMDKAAPERTQNSRAESSIKKSSERFRIKKEMIINQLARR
jgi:hypothetical protein